MLKIEEDPDQVRQQYGQAQEQLGHAAAAVGFATESPMEEDGEAAA